MSLLELRCVVLCCVVDNGWAISIGRSGLQSRRRPLRQGVLYGYPTDLPATRLVEKLSI